jgi:hypothetical protein
MDNVGHAIERVLGRSSILIAVLIFTLGPLAARAKTPDGAPPSVETVCSALQGAAFGLCNAYCEAQDCDVHPRPSCAQLLANFRRITGMPSFPCDAVCGNEVVDPAEDCDPPGSLCPDRVRTCRMDCTCPEPSCGDGIVDPGEQCDPGSPLSTCRSCQADCTCATAETSCCSCDDEPGCVDPTNAGCPDGCTPGPSGTVCSESIGRCVVPEPVCCACPGPSCFPGLNGQECELAGCFAAPLGSTCTTAGCVGIGPNP